MKNYISKFKIIYKVVKEIPKGKVATYGQVAVLTEELRNRGTEELKNIKTKRVTPRVVGPRTDFTSRRSLPVSRSRGAIMRGKWAVTPRIVGFALHANKNPNIPCHRVVDRNGRLAHNFAFDGADEQRRRLVAEGVAFKDKMHVNLERFLWDPKT